MPTSGWRKRSRSRSDRCAPSTSITTGPSISGAPFHYFSDRISNCVGALVAHGNMQLEMAFGDESFERSMHDRHGATAGRVEDLHCAPGHRIAHAQAECFRDRLLARKSGCEERQAARRMALRALLIAHKFLLAEDALGKTPAVAAYSLVDALDLDHVGADAVDHDRCRIGAALRIAARYWPTDSARPNSSASAIKAWPIDTSSTPGTAARNGPRLARFRSCPALTPSPTASAASAASV